ncbi:monooxygenase [Chitinophaga lutea]|uniref:Monooxygenase n=1 Tax=Chitinophaga lutea TaxID=2488634 RepID=A0A3N4PMW2_9BACT|nr:FAD-dependent monooxygenase [Chitinophaga lutea]RPE08938.1 monooxygenase [Chitinophaga lutea]
MIAGKKIIIIGAGVCGPALAIQLKRKGGHAEIFESRSEENIHEGAFLGITPNGLNILRQFIDLHELKEDSTPGAIKFYNAKGKMIAEGPTGYQLEKYGAETLQLKRSNLNRCIREAAAAEGVQIRYNRKLTRLEQDENTVTAFFDDGTVASGDMLIGCDGIFSTVRQQIFPGENGLRYTKLISTGGYARHPRLAQPSDAIHMTFGERGFFAYAVSGQGEVWWFNNYRRNEEPAPHEIRTTLKEEIRQNLLTVHKNDDPLFSEIIRNSSDIIAYPVYDIPELPYWYKNRVCLMGDAAHGISPHVGQGASLALEDSVVLTDLLGRKEHCSEAFAEFQAARSGRVEKIIRTARKIGDTKAKINPVAAWFRDRLIGFFIRKQLSKLDWLYGWKYPAR